MSKEEAKKVYYMIYSRVYDLLGMDFDFPEPGPLTYGELLVGRIMNKLGLKYVVEDFLPRYQCTYDVKLTEYDDDMPREK